MHEFLLFGRISSSDHQRTLQQLAGLTRMQPQLVTEVHLVYKGRAPSSISNTNSTGASQDIVAPEIQRTRALLAASLFFLRLVGERTVRSTAKQVLPVGDALCEPEVNGDVLMENGDIRDKDKYAEYKWRLEFRDIPEPGKQPVSIRLMSRTPIEEGNPFQFLSDLGYDYVSRYAVEGSKFYDQDTTLFLHRVLQLPQIAAEDLSSDTSMIPPNKTLNPLDSSGSYTLQASVEAVDGNNPELKERATRQLLAMKETWKQSIALTPGDRLALDTRVPIGPRGP